MKHLEEKYFKRAIKSLYLNIFLKKEGIKVFLDLKKHIEKMEIQLEEWRISLEITRSNVKINKNNIETLKRNIIFFETELEDENLRKDEREYYKGKIAESRLEIGNAEKKIRDTPRAIKEHNDIIEYYEDLIRLLNVVEEQMKKERFKELNPNLDAEIYFL